MADVRVAAPGARVARILPIAAMIPQRSARALVARTCRCHPEAIAYTRSAVTLAVCHRDVSMRAQLYIRTTRSVKGSAGPVRRSGAAGSSAWPWWVNVRVNEAAATAVPGSNR
jgi:hypothetical protein